METMETLPTLTTEFQIVCVILHAIPPEFMKPSHATHCPTRNKLLSDTFRLSEEAEPDEMSLQRIARQLLLRQETESVTRSLH